MKRELTSGDGFGEFPTAPGRKGFFYEVSMLVKREALGIKRDKGTLAARIGMTVGLNMIYVFVFFRIGSKNLDESIFVTRERYDLNSHFGALTMSGISAMFGLAQPVLLTFTSERPVFIREKASNMYGIMPYFLSKTLIEVPVILTTNTVALLLTYWSLALQGNFFAILLAFFLIAFAATSTALMAASMVADAKQAMEAAPGLFVPQILFAGFFIKMDLVPPFARWIQYICSLKWGMNLILIAEFSDAPEGQVLMKANDVEEDHFWLYVAVLLSLAFVQRCGALLALSRKARALYN